MHAIVARLGGELYGGGRRAVIPGPGHSRQDRSISLLLSPSGKVRVHAFSDHDWREVMDWLKANGLVSSEHRLLGGPTPELTYTPVPTEMQRTSVARSLWSQGLPVTGTVSECWLRMARKIARPLASAVLRHARDVPYRVYDPKFASGSHAFLAKVTQRDGEHTGTEITYLTPTGRKAIHLRIPRKLVGSKPPGASVHIDPVATEMVVAEGVTSALSASQYFDLPCHALLGVKSFPSWRPPAGVRHVVIAAEPGGAGEKFSGLLQVALLREGYRCRREFPPEGLSDFNAFYGGGG
ncbi:hypothetical protein Astex_3774 (plasmid) [Asticcacaulis excentricus CB 48]|uniref:Virulence-associated protein E n=2 Tax=Asticcacaulis excentricus TaxID=78587 RepID=E8RVW2_ASTEC|nr:hypothetical protein Astex_3774 [Asticcacaulis excentricus CB 48]